MNPVKRIRKRALQGDRWDSRLVLVSAALFLCGGCVTFKRPRGAWASPVVLRLPEKALAGTTVALTCGKGLQDNDRWHTASLDGCRRIGSLLRDMGATVRATPGLLPEDDTSPTGDNSDDADSVSHAPSGAKEATAPQQPDQPVDFTVQYVDRGGERDFCGWTAPLFVLSLGLFPCVEDLHSAAEIRLLDPDGALAATYPLTLDLKTIYGVPALYFKGLDWLFPERLNRRNRHTANLLLEYVRGAVYSYRVREQIAQARSAGVP